MEQASRVNQNPREGLEAIVLGDVPTPQDLRRGAFRNQRRDGIQKRGLFRRLVDNFNDTIVWIAPLSIQRRDQLKTEEKREKIVIVRFR
ncbi:MAG: hypothetical protein BWY86_00611 [Candidatus Aminicenantes bacterium ADurb.Bin508]|nr:MAG: hypothetical protein BWY86_00611 [Candidatus Aminicenantes bacterium ADurb.Bin508]